jgi:hypothetical protein
MIVTNVAYVYIKQAFKPTGCLGYKSITITSVNQKMLK